MENLTVSHPVQWRPQRFVAPLLNMTTFSTVTVSDPCHLDGGVMSCGAPAARLGPRGVLVSIIFVVNGKAPPPGGFRFASNATVAGHPARIESHPPMPDDDCAHVGAQFEIGAWVPSIHAGVAIGACLRGPGLDTLEAEVNAMLRSIRIAQ